MVVGDYEGPSPALRGFFIQDPVGDGNPATSDGIFVFVGHLPNNTLMQGKLALDEDGHLIVDKKMRTNIPGVFAAGEIMDKVYKQVATSVG